MKRLIFSRLNVIVQVFPSDLHFLELRQTLEGPGGLQHREVVVVETPGTVTESGHEEDEAKTHR